MILILSYFTATLPDYPGARQVFSVGDDGREEPDCITCTDSCLYTQAHISPTSQAFVQVRDNTVVHTTLIILALPWSFNTIHHYQVSTR